LTSRPELPRLGAIAAFTRRDASNASSYRLAIALDLVLSVLPLVIYFYISKLFDIPPSAALQNAPSYFAFVVVGLTLATVVQAGTIGIAATLRQEQFTGTLEAMGVKPVTPIEMALGIASYPFLFGTLRATLYLVLAATVFGADFSDASVPGLVIGFAVTGLALVAIGIAVAAVVFVVKRGEVFSNITVSLLVILGGAYFPVTIFPAGVEGAAKVVPTRFAFEGLRSALFTGTDWAAPILKLLVFGALALPLALLFFSWALDLAKRRGSLGQY
jgi:ABC-2 type transport system permease protein